MKHLTLLLAAAALLAGPPALGFTDPPAPPPGADTAKEAAKTNELKGDIARARQEYGSAENWYLAALRFDSRNPELYNKLGIAQLKQGRYEDARQSFSKAIRRKSDFIEALNNLGADYCLERRYKSATRYLKQALALDEQSAVTHLNLAEAWMGLNQVDRAMTEYARALELDGDILNSADSAGINAQIMTPQQRAVIDYLIAKAYAQRGNMEGALDYLQRAKQEHYRDLAGVYTEPAFAPLWNDARLTAIVKR